MHEFFFPWLLYSQYSRNQAEWDRLARCWHGLINFICKIWPKKESSHHHLGLCGRRNALTLGGCCWLWFSSSRQCCSFRRQERSSSLRLSNSECSSLHCGGEHHQGRHHHPFWGRVQGRMPCVSHPFIHLVFLPSSSLPSLSQISVCLLTVSPSLSRMCSFK